MSQERMITAEQLGSRQFRAAHGVRYAYVAGSMVKGIASEELVMRMAATNPAPAVVLIAPTGDPSPVLLDKLRDRVGAGEGTGAKQWLAEVALQKLPARPTPKPRPSAPATP